MKVRSGLFLHFWYIGIWELYSWLDESFTLFTLHSIIMVLITFGMLIYLPKEVLHRKMKDDYYALLIVMIPLIYYAVVGMVLMLFIR